MREYTCIDVPESSFDVDDGYSPKLGLYRRKILGRTMKAFVKVSSESRRFALKTLDKLVKEVQNGKK